MEPKKKPGRVARVKPLTNAAKNKIAAKEAGRLPKTNQKKRRQPIKFKKLKEGIASPKTLILKERLLEAMELALGVVTRGCEIAGCSRVTHYNFMECDPDYKARFLALDEVALDFGETELHRQIRTGEVASTIFFLKTKGKKRGYIEKMEIDQSVKRDDLLEDLPTDLLLQVARIQEFIDSKKPSE